LPSCLYASIVGDRRRNIYIQGRIHDPFRAWLPVSTFQLLQPIVSRLSRLDQNTLLSERAMKYSLSLPSLWHSIVLLLCLDVTPAASRPHPEPKSKKFRDGRHGHQARAITKRLQQRQGGACSTSPVAAAATAPKPNLWLGLTNDEAASVTKWLFAQDALNLTTTEEAGEWDNTVYMARSTYLSNLLMSS